MTFAELVAAIFGPWGAGILAFLGLIYVGRAWQKGIADRFAEKDARIAKLEALVDIATAGWTAQTAANAQGAEAQERTAVAVEAIVAEAKRVARARR